MLESDNRKLARRDCLGEQKLAEQQLLLQVDTAIRTMGAAIAPPPASGVSAALSTPKWNARPLVPQVRASACSAGMEW